ncbi:hypothetical protein F9L33_13315 [Amylibacter sp. SFDW26]|uniref:acyl-homoserine-lactone synthase n=1 Tax=Amylibacter sp. SFDW26 TaxID=2652722 RepID=UPI001262ABD2|nr:acyl-homoserine-lactone synthase [Amylibacter sp. SFDW26]KAB7610285.1 hypothetical protein F9L33_13315 [Amylibacter sp. SFDW26]
MTEITILSFPKDIDKYDLVASFLKLRNEVFINKMRWPLYQTEGMEFEQYDTLGVTYIIAHEGREVVAGARLMRTDRKFARYSYMIRDAYLELLPGLPSDICSEEPPVDHNIWEMTRFASTQNSVGAEIINQGIDFLRSKAAKGCLFLGPPAFMRFGVRLGYDPIPLGPVTGNKDGRFLAFRCDFK